MHGIATMCRVLGVSPGGYYARLKRSPSARAQADAALSARIAELHRRARQTYGMPRIFAELKAQGLRVGRKRVARLMNTAGLCGVSRRKWVTTTVRDRAAKPASDLVERNFTAAAPNRLWVADITYIPTWAGFLYLAVVLHAFSRKIVGWAMETHLRTELVLAALNLALGQRRPAAVIHHSDHGSQYTAFAFGKRCDEAGVRPSMGSVGDCFDNAMCESFFATLECELLDRISFKTQAEARMASSTSSKGGTTPIVVTPRSTISRPSLMNERTLHNLAHGAATNRKKIPHRHREPRIKQEKNNRQSTPVVLENQPINYQAQHSLLKRGSSRFVVKPRVQQDVSVLVRERRPQAVVAMLLLPQLAGDRYQRLLATLKLRVSEDLVALVREIHREVELGGVTFDEHGQRFGRYRNPLKPVALAQEAGDRFLTFLLKLGDFPIWPLPEAARAIRHHLHGFLSRLTSRRKALKAAASSSGFKPLALRSGGIRPARK